MSALEQKTVRQLNCFLVIGFLGIYLSVFQRVLDEIAKNYDLSKVAMGFLVTSHFIGLFMGPLIAGELSDKLGRKVIITSALASFLAGMVAVLLASNVYILAAGIFLAGSGFGTLELTATALLIDMSPESSNQVIGVSQIYFSIGAVAGPFIAILFIQLLGEWKVFYAISIILALVFIVTFNKGAYPVHKAEVKTDGLIVFKLLRQKVYIFLLVSMFMYVGIEEGVAFWITSYVKEKSSSGFYASIILSVFWGGMIIGRYLASRFSRNLNELIIMSAVITLGFLVMCTLTVSFPATLTAFIGLGLGLSGIWPMLMALTCNYYPRYTGTAFGIMMAFGATGGGIIPLIMGYIGDKTNLRWSLTFCLVPIVIMILCHTTVILMLREKKNDYALIG